MPIKVEAAVVTQKKQNVPFNTDSVNINGKVLPREVIQNGYKGTGLMHGTVFFSISSSEIEGFADASVAAFNERAEAFHSPDAAAAEIITGYFKDSVYALGEMGHRSSELASSIFYASDDSVILAKTGNIQLYAYSKNGFAKVSPALFANVDGTSQYGICSFPSVAVGDIFLLVSPGVSQVLTDKDLDDICKAAEGSIKKIVNLIAKVTAVKQGDGGITAIAVKVVEINGGAENINFTFADATDKLTERNDTESPSVSVLDAPEDKLYAGHDEDQPTKGRKAVVAVLVALVIIALLACGALAFKLFGGTVPDFFKKTEPTTVVITTAKETTTKQDVTTTAAAVTTTKPVTTTAVVTTTEKQTTAAPTSSRSSYTYRYEEEEEEEEEEENTTAENPTEEENTTQEENPTSEQPTSESSTEEQPSSEAPSSDEPSSEQAETPSESDLSESDSE